MAKTTKRVKARRAMPRSRRHARPGALTIGELVAAAFDVTGGDARKATKILGSRELAEVLGRRIVIA